MRHQIRKRREGAWKTVYTFEELNEIVEEDDMRAVALLDAASDGSAVELPGIGTRYNYWDGSWMYYLRG